MNCLSMAKIKLLVTFRETRFNHGENCEEYSVATLSIFINRSAVHNIRIRTYRVAQKNVYTLSSSISLE
jgi:hypothetical protein